MSATATVTVRQLRHDLKSVEAALENGPVEVTKRGKVVWTIVPVEVSNKTKKEAEWALQTKSERSRKILGAAADIPINVLDFLG